MFCCCDKSKPKSDEPQPPKGKELPKDFKAKNIKGVILRIQHYEGMKGLKDQAKRNWPEVNEDYFIIQKFLKSDKAKDKKFLKPTTIAKNRMIQIERLSQFSNGKFVLDKNLKNEEKNENLKKNPINENSKRNSMKSQDSNFSYLKQISDVEVPVYNAQADGYGKTISQIGMNMEQIKQKYGFETNTKIKGYNQNNEKAIEPVDIVMKRRGSLSEYG